MTHETKPTADPNLTTLLALANALVALAETLTVMAQTDRELWLHLLAHRCMGYTGPGRPLSGEDS